MLLSDGVATRLYLIRHKGGQTIAAHPTSMRAAAPRSKVGSLSFSDRCGNGFHPSTDRSEEPHGMQERTTVDISPVKEPVRLVGPEEVSQRNV